MVDITKISNKEIQYNQMIALMSIAGYMAEILDKMTIPDMLTGGEIDELTKSDK